ncbi:MAG TPA: hypothetical protein DCZ95_09240 [Verrucomicrobia bacterium]|nr:hypothetical protein [Verrucomicrobiota bacterium]
MSKKGGWLGLCFCAMFLAMGAWAENEAVYYPDGQLYIPKVDFLDRQGNVLRSYEALLKKKGRGWNFRLHGVSPAAKETDVDVSGRWSFQLHDTTDYFYTSTNWYWSTNFISTTDSLVVTLAQAADQTVSGSGETNGVKVLITGRVSDEHFFFAMFIGQPNEQVGLLSCQSVANGDSLEGFYFYNYTNGYDLVGGAFSATRQP